MKLSTTLLTGVFAAVLSAPALAADLSPRAPQAAPVYQAPPQAFDWRGFYLGVNGGYGMGRSSWDDPALAIDWPVTAPVLSPKDRSAPLLADIAPERLPIFVP